MKNLNEQDYLSIGDVLAHLKKEFPDITISKIRFLESQGLLDPQRTPSGFRKFFDSDIVRLRWILYQQKEHFLPLRVIKRKLEQGGPFEQQESLFNPNTLSEDSPTSNSLPTPLLITQDSKDVGGGSEGTVNPDNGASNAAVTSINPNANSSDAKGISKNGTSTPTPTSLPPADTLGPDTLGSAPTVLSSLDAGSDEDTVVGFNAGFSIEEVCDLTGITLGGLTELESFGFLQPKMIGGEPVYDELSVEAVKILLSFRAFGIHPRHLRIYKNAIDRETGFLEQIIAPLLRQRNPKAQQKAGQMLNELASLGQQLRSVLLQQAFKNI